MGSMDDLSIRVCPPAALQRNTESLDAGSASSMQLSEMLLGWSVYLK